MIVLHKKDIANYLNMDARLTAALQMIADGAVENDPIGKTVDSDQMYHIVQCYDSKPFEQTKWESHKKYIDIQYIISGLERIDTAIVEDGFTVTSHNEEKDCLLYQTDENAFISPLVLSAGTMAVLYPEDLHRPQIAVGDPQEVKKIVFKIRV